MSNQMVAFSGANLPAALQQRLAQFNAGNVLAKLGGSDGIDRIRIRGGRFRIDQVGMEEVTLNQLHLDCVIVYANPYKSRAYYDKPYNKDDADQSPACASSNGFGPDQGVRSPQSVQCATCPQAVWGSKISANGKKIPACGEAQRLAVLPIDPSTNNFFMVDGKPKAFALNVPSTSTKPLGIFAKTLEQQGIPLEIVLARLTFNEQADGQKLEFAFGSVLPEQAAVYILDYIEQNKDKLNELVGANIKAAQNVQPTQPQAAAPVAAPVVETPQVAPVSPAPVAPVMPAAAPAPNFAPQQVAAPAPAPVAPAPTVSAAPASLLSALQGVMG